MTDQNRREGGSLALTYAPFFQGVVWQEMGIDLKEGRVPKFTEAEKKKKKKTPTDEWTKVNEAVKDLEKTLKAENGKGPKTDAVISLFREHMRGALNKSKTAKLSKIAEKEQIITKQAEAIEELKRQIEALQASKPHKKAG